MLATLNLTPDRKQLREFGLFAFLAFGLLGILVRWRGGLFGVSFGAWADNVSYVLWGLGAISAFFAAVLPRANTPLFVGLSLLAFPIGIVVSHAVLALLFFGVLTPVALVFRILGRDSLERRFEPERASYWVDLDDGDDGPAKERYFRQF